MLLRIYVLLANIYVSAHAPIWPTSCRKTCVGKFLTSATLSSQDGVVGRATRYRLDGLGLNPSGNNIFCTCPHWPWGPPILLYSEYQSFDGGKVSVASCWPHPHPHPPSAAVADWLELYSNLLSVPAKMSWVDHLYLLFWKSDRRYALAGKPAAGHQNWVSVLLRWGHDIYDSLLLTISSWNFIGQCDWLLMFRFLCQTVHNSVMTCIPITWYFEVMCGNSFLTFC